MHESGLKRDSTGQGGQPQRGQLVLDELAAADDDVAPLLVDLEDLGVERRRGTQRNRDSER